MGNSKIIFLIPQQKPMLWPYLEPSRWDGSNEGSQNMFFCRNMDSHPWIIPVTPSYLEHWILQVFYKNSVILQKYKEFIMPVKALQIIQIYRWCTCSSGQIVLIHRKLLRLADTLSGEATLPFTFFLPFPLGGSTLTRKRIVCSGINAFLHAMTHFNTASSYREGNRKTQKQPLSKMAEKHVYVSIHNKIPGTHMIQGCFC